MQDIGLAILYLTALAAYLSLAWQIWCAGRWLRRRWFPTFSERASNRFRAYTPRSVPIPHPLWALQPLSPESEAEYRRVFSQPDLTPEEMEEAFHIPRTGSSFRPPSSPDTMPPEGVPTTGHTSSQW